MQYLIDFAGGDDFGDIARRALEYDLVQGLVIDLDPFWLQAARVWRRFGTRYLEWWVEHPIVHDDLDAYPPRPLDLGFITEWRPPGWTSYAKTLGLADDPLPFVVKVCLRSGEPGHKIPQAGDLSPSNRRVRVVVEFRPPAILCASPRKRRRPVPGGVSISVGKNDFGTLGVIMTNDAGDHFGVSCSHVVSLNVDVYQPAQYDSRKASVIGSRVAGIALTQSAAGSKCNPWSGGTVNEHDVAVISIDSAKAAALREVLNIGKLNGVVPRASLTTGQSVEVNGRTTGYNSLSIGGLAAWYEFKHQGSSYCFKNLFEVQSPYGSTRPIRDGDSGAPVCIAHNGGTGWCGMIVGCDTYKGYAMYSETAEGWYTGQGYFLSFV